MTRRAQVFTASGTWYLPDGVTVVDVTCVGGGGGGGGALYSGTLGAGAGGGGGGFAVRGEDIPVTGNVTVTIGIAGTAGTGAPTNGGAGGTSSFGSLLSAYGGGY